MDATVDANVMSQIDRTSPESARDNCTRAEDNVRHSQFEIHRKKYRVDNPAAHVILVQQRNIKPKLRSR